MARNTNNRTDPQRSTALKRSVRKLLVGLNMFDQDRYLFGLQDREEENQSTFVNCIPQKVREHDQETPQLHTADQPTAPCGRATEHL